MRSLPPSLRSALLAAAGALALAPACGSPAGSGGSGAGGGTTVTSSSSAGPGGGTTVASSSAGTGCTDACTGGAVRCQGNGVETCEALASGCQGWSAAVACPSGDVCSGGVCSATCTNQCTAGATRCSGNGVETCASMASGCTDWGSAVACSGTETCSGGQCVTACTDQCTLGATQCYFADQVQTCTSMANGCTDWAAPVDCPTSETCTQGACKTPDPCAGVQCTTPPAPTCTTATSVTVSSSPGTCTAGVCSYSATTMTCATICLGGACSGQVTATMVSAGDAHTCAVTSAGAVLCWGFDFYGQLGDGQTTGNPVRAAVAVVGLSSGVSAVSVGYQHSCALTTTGGVQCWGYNGDGELGDGSTTNSAVPVAVTGLSSGVVAISAHNAHTCALTTAGAVLCWGDNQYGELGNNATVASSVPVAVTGLSSGVLSVSSGDFHTCAVTAAGAAECWGYNATGQLGDNSLTESLVPVAVMGLSSGVKAVSAGDKRACALTTGGAVKCWGDNTAGALGYNNSTNPESLVPVSVSGLSSGVLAVSAGGLHTCALLSGGKIMCWGGNDFGGLGIGDTVDSPVPVMVQGGVAPDFLTVSAGFEHTCAVGSPGRLMCWGVNSHGELGDNMPTNSYYPAIVLGF